MRKWLEKVRKKRERFQFTIKPPGLTENRRVELQQKITQYREENPVINVCLWIIISICSQKYNTNCAPDNLFIMFNMITCTNASQGTIQSIYFKIYYFVSTGTYSMVHLIYCIYLKLNDYIKCMLNGYINTGHRMSW